MEDIQNFAGMVEEVKDKLSDSEYKDFLELSKKIYDKKEKTKKKFMKVLCIKSQMILDMTATFDYDPDDNITHQEDLVNQHMCSEIDFEYGDCDSLCDCDEYKGKIKQLRLKGKVRQTQQIILFEVTTRSRIDNYCIDMNICKMTDYAYDTLLKDKHMVDDVYNQISFVYLSHFEL